MLPTFIVIGPGRSGSTMLYQAFKEHPDICMAKNIKETNYFNHEYHRGTEWYQTFFEHCQTQNAVGEISNMYIYDPETPARIANLLPDVKLIAILRNPFDRIRSAWGFRRKSGEISPQMSLKDAVQQYPDLITDNYYGEQLDRYLGHFSRKNLLITFFDDLENNPEQFIQTIFAFIGVDDSVRPTAIYERVNQAAAARHPLLASLVRFSADTLRRWQLYSLLDKAKGSAALRQLIFKPLPTSSRQIEFSDQLLILLREHFIPQIEEVERLTGRSLAHWYL